MHSIRFLPFASALAFSLFPVAAGNPPSGAVKSIGVTNTERRPDVAYEASTDSYLVVNEVHHSATNRDVFAQRVDKNGIRIGARLLIAFGTADQAQPAVATIASRKAFLVTWSTNVNGSWNIYARAVDATTGAMSHVAHVATTRSNETDPDVGGERLGRSARGSVVWSVDNAAIHGRTVTVPQRSSAWRLSVGPAKTLVPWRGKPSISRAPSYSHLVPDTYCLAWSADVNVIYYQSFDGNLAPRTGLNYRKVDYRVESVDVDGDGQNFTTVSQRRWAGWSSREIWATALEVPTAGGLRLLGDRRLVGNFKQTKTSELHPAIGMIGGDFVAAWTHQRSPAANDTEVRTLRMVKGSVYRTGVIHTIGLAHVADSWPAVVSNNSGGYSPRPDQGLIAWQGRSLALGHDHTYFRHFQRAVSGPLRSMHPGCAGGGKVGHARPESKLATGSLFMPGLSGADPSATMGMFVIAPARERLLRCGVCELVKDTIAIPVSVRNGAAMLKIRIPPMGLGGPIYVDMQFWVARSKSSPCGLLPGLTTSEIIRGTLMD